MPVVNHRKTERSTARTRKAKQKEKGQEVKKKKNVVLSSLHVVNVQYK